MYILLSSEETLYNVKTKPFLARGRTEQVGAALFSKLKHSLPTKQQQEQSDYINTAAKAAYASLNKLDWTGAFHAEINLTTNTDTPLSFERDSSSVGLGYALALALEWRKQLNKPIDYDVEVFATGEIHSSGSVTAIGHLETKVTAACNFMEAKKQKGALQQAFVVFYPSANEDDITFELQTRVKSLGGQLFPVDRLQSALVTLLGDAYDGDAEGRWEPFKGLLSFNYEDSLRFFGRERALAKLSQEFGEAEGLVVVTGVSGSGKSSLIKAGLIPQISHTARDEGKAFDWLVSLPKTHDSIEGILTELLQTLDVHWSSHLASHVAEAFTSPDIFITLVKQAQASQPTKRFFYYIDQYEDVFNHQDISREQAQQLAPLLAQLAKNIPNLDIMISIRSEYENMLGQYGSVSHVNPELNASEWRDIVYKQATSFGLRYEEGLEKRIVNEASRILHALPALEYLLEQLYKKAKASDKNKRLLTHEDYEQLKGIKGVIAARAEEVIAKHLMQAHAFFEYFVGLNNENKPYAKSVNIEAVQEENASLHALIQAFIDAQLVVDCSTNTEKQVKLAHDTLFNFDNEDSAWTALKEWIEESQEYLQWLNIISGGFKRWKALKSQQEVDNKGNLSFAFLLNEHDLKVGQAFQQLNKIQQPKVRAYIAQSQYRKEALLKEKNRKQRFVILLVGVFLVVALGAGFVAYKKEQEATNQKSIALEQKFEAERQAKIALDEKERSEKLFRKAENERLLKEDAKARASWLGEDRRKFRDILKTVSQIFPTKAENLAFIKGRLGVAHIEDILTYNIDSFELDLYQNVSALIVSRQAFPRGAVAKLFNPSSLAPKQKGISEFMSKFEGDDMAFLAKKKQLTRVMIRSINITEKQKQDYLEALEKLDAEGVSGLYSDLSKFVYNLENREFVKGIQNINLAVSIVETGADRITANMLSQLTQNQLDFVVSKLYQINELSEELFLSATEAYLKKKYCPVELVGFENREKITGGLNEKALNRYIQFVSNSIDDGNVQCMHFTIKNTLGSKVNALLSAGSYESALYYATKYTELLNRLKALSVDNAFDLKVDISEGYRSKSFAFKALNDSEGELSSLLASLSIIETLLTESPRNKEVNVNSVAVKMDIAEAYLSMEKPSSALELMLSAEKTLESLGEMSKGSYNYLIIRSDFYKKLGQVYLVLNQRNESQAVFSKVLIDIMPEVQDQLSKNVEKILKDDLLSINEKLHRIDAVYTDARRPSGDHDVLPELLDLISKTESITKKERKYYKEDVIPKMRKKQLTRLYWTLKREKELLKVLEVKAAADSLFFQGQYRVGVAMYLNAITILEELYQGNPQSFIDRKSLSELFNKLSKIYSLIGEVDKSITAYQDSLSVCERYRFQDYTKIASCYYDLTTAEWETDKSDILLRYDDKYGDIPVGDMNVLRDLYLNGSWYLITSGEASKVITIIENKLPEFGVDSQILLSTNLAHAYLLSGSYEKAKGLYKKYKGKKVKDGKLWDQVIMADFEALDKQGMFHSHFGLISNEVFIK